MAASYGDDLPPRELWPDLIRRLPELQYPETLNVAAEILDRHVDEGHGDRLAIRHGDRRITYAELQRMVNRIGNGLRGLGVAPGDRVLLRFPNRPEFAGTWLAVQKIGAVTVSTMPMLRARELGYIAADAGVKVAVVAADLEEEWRKAAAALDPPPITVTAGAAGGPAAASGGPRLETLIDDSSDRLDAHPTGRDDLALIAYTSGSTGAPKGTCHTPGDILASSDTYARHVLEPKPDDVFGGHPTLAFTYGLGGLLVFPLRFGASAVLLEGFTPERMLETVAAHRITVLFCAATTYRLLLQVPEFERRFDLGSLRLAISAGETLPRPVYDEWIARTGIDLLDCLGTTELFHVFVCGRPGAVRPGATGLPVPGYEVRIVDDRLNELPRGTQGLIAVRGPTGCRYWRKPDRQRDYVRGGWNITGDVYVQDEDGYLWYQCRNDDLIISGGYNIAGPEVEAVVLEHPAVLEVAVVATPDPVRGAVPKAFVVLKPSHAGSDALVADLQAHVKRELAPYKYPREVEFVESLPKTETGKIRRVELRERERERKAGGRSAAG